MTTYLITGETYMARKQIKSFGYKWSKEDSGRIGKEYPEELQSLIQEKDKIYIEEIEDKEIPEISKIDYQILKAKKYIEKHENEILKYTKEAETSRISEQERNFLSLGEPVKVGHHSEKRHRKLLERFDKDFERRGQAYKNAEDSERTLEYWKDELKILEEKKAGTWKNAKQRKLEEIERIKSKIKVGDFVETGMGNGKIEKINKKTFRLEGKSWNIDIDYIFNI